MSNSVPNAVPHRATNRVIDILEAIASAQGELALRDLSATLDAPKSSLLPLLRTLTVRGYLDISSNGAYRLGQKVLEIGAGTPGRHDLPEAARPGLIRLTEKTGEPSFIGMLLSDRSGVVYIDRVVSRQTIRFSVELGEKRALHATAVGKAILAFLPEDDREAIISTLKLVRYTPNTISTRGKLREALDAVRRDGVCINLEEALPGAVAIAAPIFDRAGLVVAACAIGAPSARARPQLRKLAAEVQAAAISISRVLGYHPAVDNSLKRRN